MRLTSRRTLAVEVAGTRLTLVEVDPTTDPPTIHCAVVGAAAAPTLAESLRALVREHRITARDTHLVLSEAAATHRVMLIPPMSAEDRALFLDREIARESRAKSLVGHTVLQRVDGPPPKDEVLLAALAEEEASPALAGLLHARLPPRLVTTGALALATVAYVLSPWPVDQPVAVAHWGSRGLTIIVIDDGALKFTRDVPHLVVPGIDAREWFVTEVQRSLRQYTQTTKGAAVAGILIGSIDAQFEDAVSDVGARLGLQVASLNDAVRALLPEEEEGADEAAPRAAGAFVLPLGAALLAPQETANLLPPSIEAGRRRRLLVRGAAAAGALLVLALGYASWGASGEVATYRRVAAQAANARQAREAEAAGRERVKRERETQYQRIALLKSDPLGDPPLADVFREISRAAPEGLRLERLLLTREASAMTLRIAGRVESVDLARAQAEFNRFYFGLERSPLVAEVVLNPPAASKVTIQQGPPQAVEGRTARDFRRSEADEDRDKFGGRGKKLAFELELRLRGVK